MIQRRSSRISYWSPPEGTHPVELLLQRVSEEEAAPSNVPFEEQTAWVMEVTNFSEDSGEDFGPFNQSFSHLLAAEVSSS